MKHLYMLENFQPCLIEIGSMGWSRYMVPPYQSIPNVLRFRHFLIAARVRDLEILSLTAVVIIIYNYEVPPKTLQWYIYLSIDFFFSCCGFSLIRKKLLVCRKKCPRGFIPSPFSVVLQFLNLRLLHFLVDIICVLLRKFSLKLVTSVASKRTNPVFSRAGVAKRKQVELRKIARIRNLRYELEKG